MDCSLSPSLSFFLSLSPFFFLLFSFKYSHIFPHPTHTNIHTYMLAQSSHSNSTATSTYTVHHASHHTHTHTHTHTFLPLQYQRKVPGVLCAPASSESLPGPEYSCAPDWLSLSVPLSRGRWHTWLRCWPGGLGPCRCCWLPCLF